MVELRGIVPARWVLPTEPFKYDEQVLINWLDVEVPAVTSIVPTLTNVSGWRNREVYWYIKTSGDWTARMYE